MIALDIGAGSTSFGKELRRLNPSVRTVICGDIRFQRQEYGEEVLQNIGVFLSRFSKILTQEEFEDVIKKSRKGVFKVFARYEEIPLEDESTDIVTLNSPHPMMHPRDNGFKEMCRVLKKGGIFYFGHSRSITGGFNGEVMQLLGEGSFRFGSMLGRGRIDRCILPEEKLIFPMSPIIRGNLIEQELMKRGKKSESGYIYGNGPGKIPLDPCWKAWRKAA